MTEGVHIGDELTIDDVVQVTRHAAPVAFSAPARDRVRRSRHAVERIVEAGDAGPPVYGINTGFGALAETRVAADQLTSLQRNLIRSHACGVGPDLGPAEVRGIMLLRAQVIGLGHSGVRTEVVDLLIAMLNEGVHPRIPSKGSVGASGDLAPLAHLALVLIGEGEADYQGERLAGGDALARAGLAPIELAPKEGLALINGTQFMTSLGALAAADALELCRLADLIGAVSLEALLGTQRPFSDRLMQLRPHPGQATVAANLVRLLAGSGIMESHRDCSKVQDPYSLRCMPQVHGATRDVVAYATEVVRREVNSVTDNPTVLLPEDADGELLVISGGNFHGQPVAIALDAMALGVAELGNMSERRVEQLVNPALSTGLTPFLAPPGGMHSGFMIAQVASASLVSENKVLAHPACVDSIPSSAGKEDHVSMGSVSATKLAAMLENVRQSLAIELLVACEGIEQRRPRRSSPAVEAAHAEVRAVVEPLTEDRPLYRDIEQVANLLRSGRLLSVMASAGHHID